jgi:small neutral amino acid transporter SnatA (MarC family)
MLKTLAYIYTSGSVDLVDTLLTILLIVLIVWLIVTIAKRI